MKARWFFFAPLLLFFSCNDITDLLDKSAKKGMFGASTEMLGDQGVLNFDDTGNITVIFNNTEFRTNTLYNSTSYIGVWVFKRGADPYSRCCAGSGCSSIEANSCIQGMGFSNDLGFSGTNYLDVQPMMPFDTQTSRFYIPVYAATNDGLPASYQGEYTPLSSPTGVVTDRTQFDVYIGTYYSVLSSEILPNRAVSRKKTIGGLDYYEPVNPDWLSPVMQVEAKFFRQSDIDVPGSSYMIPPLLAWRWHGELNRFPDYRNKVIINELLLDPPGTDGQAASPELVEIYNNSGRSVSLNGFRISAHSISSIDLGISSGTTFLATTEMPPGAYLVLALYNSGQSGLPGDVLVTDTDFSDGKALVKIDGNAGLAQSNGSVRFYSDASSTIIDYVQFSNGVCSTSQTGLSSAVSAGIWTSGNCVNVNALLRRLPNGVDTNTPADWTASPAGGETPGAPNT